MNSQLLQVFTRVYLHELSGQISRPATLSDIPDATIDQWANSGFNFIWMLGMWQTGEKGKQVSLTEQTWQAGFRQALPDLNQADVSGSPFAIRSYNVHEDFGDKASLKKFRARLNKRGLKLLLDFVPNHTALDHPWASRHPEYYMRGSEADLEHEPQNYISVATTAGQKILAYGRDPYFSGWPDTLQLNYFSPMVNLKMQDELAGIARLCDGVRCDMAMLVLPEIFTRTWGDRAVPGNDNPVQESFWPVAIQKVREEYPDFIFMAEVYWDLEWTMHQHGFDLAYDKRLYDRLRAPNAQEVRSHLVAGPDYQNKLVRFLENHDEPRAAATFAPGIHQAAAVITYLTPGLRFFYEGQFTGRKIHASVHLGRRPEETVDAEIQDFYRRLLECLRRQEVRAGHWQLLECNPVWDDNPTHTQFVAFSWELAEKVLLVVVNYASRPGQCRVVVRNEQFESNDVELTDLMNSATYLRSGNEMAGMGLFVDLPAWGYHVFTCAIRQ